MQGWADRPPPGFVMHVKAFGLMTRHPVRLEQLPPDLRRIALLRGRDYVLPADVADVAPEIMAHRIVLTFDALADGADTRGLVAKILATVPPPRVIWPVGHPENPGSGDQPRP